MEFEAVIKARRSVRAFTSAEPDPAMIEAILRSGHAAPSGGHMQEWRFNVVRDSETSKALAETAFIPEQGEGGDGQAWLADAPVIIVVSADHRKGMRRCNRRGIGSILYNDIGCCVENMLLRAVDLGLAACMAGCIRAEEVAELLNTPEYLYEPVVLMAIGYPAEQSIEKTPVEPVIYFDRFGGKREEWA